MKHLGFLPIILILSMGVEWAGVECNMKAMRDNGGKMPVLCLNEWMANIVKTDPIHMPLTSSSHDVVLDDIIIIPEFNSLGVDIAIGSVGDALIWLGKGFFCAAPFIVAFLCLKSLCRVLAARRLAG